MIEALIDSFKKVRVQLAVNYQKSVIYHYFYFTQYTHTNLSYEWYTVIGNSIIHCLGNNSPLYLRPKYHFVPFCYFLPPPFLPLLTILTFTASLPSSPSLFFSPIRYCRYIGPTTTIITITITITTSLPPRLYKALV